MTINDSDQSIKIEEKPVEIKQPDNLSPPISEELELNAFADILGFEQKEMT